MAFRQNLPLRDILLTTPTYLAFLARKGGRPSRARKGKIDSITEGRLNSCKLSRSNKHLNSWFLLLAILTAGCGGAYSPAPMPPPPPPPGPATFELIPVASGFSNPLDVQQPNDGTGRLFVVEQGGHIQIIQSDGTRVAAPFLNVSSRSGFTSGGETGLLGLAFHPTYAQNRRFFVNYTRNSGGQLQSVIAEFTTSSSDPNFADANTENILFTVNQPFSNHKGGALVFGQDGFLYIGLGDGGSGGDPQCNGQNVNVLLGKILRIDVDAPHSSGLNYAIPSSNPFVGQNARSEIWLYGLRNRYRFYFDTGN